MSELQAPLVPAEVDLTDFQFMPLDVARLRRSKGWLICKRTPELAFYMMNLWTAAWHSVPAGSLEDDDDVLADLAMCSPRYWSRVREKVLRGWVRCSDGRLYHQVVVEKVLEAWNSKLIHAYDRECGRLRKAATRLGNKDFSPPSFEQWKGDRDARMSQGQASMSGGHPDMSRGHPEDKVRTSQGIPAEIALKGQGQGQGQGQGYIPSSVCPVDTSGRDSSDQERFARVKKAYPQFSGKQSDWLLAERACSQRVEEGATWQELEEAAFRFSAFVAAGGRSGPQFVDLPSKFFGNGLWRESWTPPPTKAEQRTAANVSAFDQVRREIREGKT